MPADSTTWLLEATNPSIRYRALLDLRPSGTGDDEISQAYSDVINSSDVARVLGKRRADGLWDESDFGVHTSLRYLTALAELGMRRDSRLDAAIDHAVRFLETKAAAAGTQRYDGCSAPLLLRAIVMLGYADWPGVRELTESHMRTQLTDGGYICKRLLDQRADRKSCYRACVSTLLLCAACRRAGWDLPGAERLVDYFLARDVFYCSSDRARLVVDGRPGWRYVDNFFPVESMRVGLPLIVAALSVLGAGHEKALGAGWDTLASKTTGGGRLVLEGTLTKQPCSFGKVGQENKWLTYYARIAEQARESSGGA